MTRAPIRLPLVLAALAAAWLAGAARAEVVDETWFVVQMQGQRAGWGFEREVVDDSGARRFESEMVFRIGRMGQEVELAIDTRTTADARGRLAEMVYEQDFGVMSQRTTYRFEGDKVISISEQGGRSVEKELERPGGDWLSPFEASDAVVEKINEGAETFTVRTIDASMGLQVVDLTYTIDERTTVEAMGKTKPAIRWVVRNSLIPSVETVEYVDDEGETVRTELSMAGLDLVILESEKEFALSPFEGPDLMESTLITPSRPIERARWSTRGEFVVSVAEGRIPDLAVGGAQRVEREADNRLRVKIDVENPLPATEAEIADPRYLAPSAYADSEDPEIVATLVKATEGVGDEPPLVRARAIEKFVSRFVDAKSLGVGFATASEVCQTRQGDCSEHAVLLCALLRADGIPSRAVSGLVYVDQFVGERNVFGYHMWSQALIEIDGEPQWIDLDAAVYPFDATHIAVVTSSLADDDMINSMVGVAETLGELEIEVIEVE
jgi:hypothetical protein